MPSFQVLLMWVDACVGVGGPLFLSKFRLYLLKIYFSLMTKSELLFVVAEVLYN